MRVLVTGGRGLLSAAVAEKFAGEAEVHVFDRAQLDITDMQAVQDAVARVAPDVIVNGAAYNDVDGAEDDPQAAMNVNAVGVIALAHAARKCGATLVHYSTDFVFDGDTDRPYVEEAPPSPRGVYAASKLLGDWFAADVPRHYVLRVESLFGGPGTRTGARRGSLGRIVDLIRSGAEVPVFVDRTVSPSYAPDVAAATSRILAVSPPAGTYHCVNSGAATWADIARETARQIGCDLHIRELTIESAKLKAPRPRYCALSNARLARLGIVMPAWQDAVGRYLDELNAAG